MKTKAGNGVWGSVLIYGLVISAILITLYPFIYIISLSISEPMEIMKRSVWFLPKGFSLESYRTLLGDPAVLQAYYNTLWYTVVGTLVNVTLTVMAAYALSKKTFFLRRQLSLYIVIPMFVSGGIIPLYIVVTSLGMYNTPWALIFPTAISAFNLIVARTYFESLPESLSESAKLDGANDLTILLRIMVPIAKPIISVLTIFYAVYHWNEYFNPMLYLSDGDLQPIQLYLRNILVAGMTSGTAPVSGQGIARTFIYEQMKYASIVIAVLPITIIYPFFQRHFVQGVMIGAVKG